jgi:hypothetical protein
MVSRIVTYDSEPFRLLFLLAGAVSARSLALSWPQSHESVHSGGVPASDSLDHLISTGWRTVLCR